MGIHYRYFSGLLSFAILTWSLGLVKCEPRRPPNYHHDHMPDTSFTCSGKVVGGYYADPDADCQMFHVCVQVDEDDVRDFKFMCPNDTVFDQESFICANWFEVDCKSSTLYYDKNLQLFQTHDDINKNNKNGHKQTVTSTEEPSEQQRRQQEQQRQQLQILEEQQQQQVLRQQQILEQHERRQQEHQRQQLQILQQQQRQLEQLRPEGRKIPSGPAISQSEKIITTVSQSKTEKVPTTTVVTEGQATEEYDYYYYYDEDESTEKGHFYLNDEYDPKLPTSRIVEPTNARPPLLSIVPAKSISTSTNIP